MQYYRRGVTCVTLQKITPEQDRVKLFFEIRRESKRNTELNEERREKFFLYSFRAKEKMRGASGGVGRRRSGRQLLREHGMQNTAPFGEAGSWPCLGQRKGGSFLPPAASTARARKCQRVRLLADKIPRTALYAER